MNNPEALDLVKNTFTEILKAPDVSVLKEMLSNHPTLNSWRMDRSKYPELQLEVTAKDISSLMTDKLDEDLRLHADLSARLRPTSLTNGPGQVFRQFGRHLADRSESIVDQHVLRAFELYEQMNTPNSAKVK